MNYNSRRAPGADVQRIQFSYEGKPFALKNFALDAPVPREVVRDAKAVPGVDLGKRAVNTVMNSLTLTLEIEQAALATDPQNCDDGNVRPLSGTACWDGGHDKHLRQSGPNLGHLSPRNDRAD